MARRRRTYRRRASTTRRFLRRKRFRRYKAIGIPRQYVDTMLQATAVVWHGNNDGTASYLQIKNSDGDYYTNRTFYDWLKGDSEFTSRKNMFQQFKVISVRLCFVPHSSNWAANVDSGVCKVMVLPYRDNQPLRLTTADSDFSRVLNPHEKQYFFFNLPYMRYISTNIEQDPAKDFMNKWSISFYSDDNVLRVNGFMWNLEVQFMLRYRWFVN